MKKINTVSHRAILYLVLAVSASGIFGLYAFCSAPKFFAASVSAKAENPYFNLVEKPLAKNSSNDRQSTNCVSLEQGDFNQDGVNDVIVGCSGANPFVSVHMGNPDALYPFGAAARASRASGTFSDAPFPAAAKIISLETDPDFLAVGNFDGDRQNFTDLIVASRGGDRIFLYSGDGSGNFAPGETLNLGGTITALTAGEMNASDGLEDLIVAVRRENENQVLIFENPHGALKGAPEVFNFQNPIESLALGQLDDEAAGDLAVAAGDELTIIFGRNRKLSLDNELRLKVPAAVISNRTFSGKIHQVIIGDFHAGQINDLALLMDGGELNVLSRRVLERGELTEQRELARWQPQIVTESGLSDDAEIIAAHSGSFPADTILAFNPSSDEIRFAALENPAQSTIKIARSLTLSSAPRRILARRLNDDAPEDLLILDQSGQLNSLVTVPQQTFIVNTTADLPDLNTGDNLCAASDGTCTLRAAIQQANAAPGADEIQFAIPGSGVQTIRLNSTLEAAPDLTIRGDTQPGYNGTPLIELRFNFTVDYSGAAGLRITGNSVVRGLAFSKFFMPDLGLSVYGLDITSGGRNRVEKCEFGSIEKNRVAIHIDSADNIIGGSADARNLITKSCIGIRISAPIGTGPNIISGNYIISNNVFNGPQDGPCGHGIVATNNEGTVPNPQLSNDNLLIGGETVGERNVISGQDKGIWLISSKSVKVRGNYIGTDFAGTGAMPQNRGVEDEGTTTFIGGSTAAAGNVISGNIYGINLGGTNGVVQNNCIGLDNSCENSLANAAGGNDVGIVIATGSGNTIGGNSSAFGNIISGNNGESVPPNMRKATGILAENGILGGNIIIGNIIGLTKGGGGGHGNGNAKTGGGVASSGGGIKIGSAGSGSRNVISGNDGPGISIGGTGGNTVEGVEVLNNYIGTDKNGDNGGVGNQGDGVAVTTFVFSSTIIANRIAYNTGSGVTISEGDGNDVSRQISVENNEIFANGQMLFNNGQMRLNLDLRNNGVIEPNDDRDFDTGANDLQNYPQNFTAAVNGSNLKVSGTFNSLSNSTFNLEFYISQQCYDGQAQSLPFPLAGHPVVTDAQGNASYIFTLPLPADAPRTGFVQATAIDITNGGNLGKNTSEYSPCVPVRSLFDFDGDGKADVSVFRPDNGTWYLLQSANGFNGLQFGLGTDKLVPADYDGDGKTDVAVYRSGFWYLQRSSAGFTGLQFGASEDIPVPADYDGDGRADLAVYRPSNGTWYLLGSSRGFSGVQFGISTDKPVPADYDGDGKADIAVNRAGTWYLQRSQLGFTGLLFGNPDDKIVPADYDGDGATDIAVYRNGFWYLLQSRAGFTAIQFGTATDLPAPADYDGDGRADLAVYRGGIWYLQKSTAGFGAIQFGAAADAPVSAAFVK